VRLFLEKSRVGFGCSVGTRSENAVVVIDTSAIVAAIANEPDGNVYRTVIKTAPVRVMSAGDANSSVLTAWLKCDYNI
jgi:hypothetical protein